MRDRFGVLLCVLAAAGCHGLAPTALAPVAGSDKRQDAASNTPRPTSLPDADLPVTNPVVPVLDARGLAKVSPRSPSSQEGLTFRALKESDCLMLATANSTTANLLEEENTQTGGSLNTRCKATAREDLRKSFRQAMALEVRNQAAAEALERFFQLAELEARIDLLRQSFIILDGAIEKARAAKAQDVRYPLEITDLERQRSLLESQLEQAELSEKLLALDLTRRLSLPSRPATDRLWPIGNFSIVPAQDDPDAAVNAALADRPELRGLRAFQQGLTTETLPDARDLLRTFSPLLGMGSAGSGPHLSRLLECLVQRSRSAETAAKSELEARKQQLQQLITEQEKVVADEARAAALTANAQRIRAAHSQDRLQGWEQQLVEAVKKQQAGQPGAEFQVPRLRLEVLKARSELAGEAAAWHQARIRLRAAEGWLVWEALTQRRKAEAAGPVR